MADDVRGALLVGSVPLRSTEQVMRAAAALLGPQLRRVPDGETGERTLWNTWQLPVLARNPAFEAPRVRMLAPALRAYSRVPVVRRAANAALVALARGGRMSASAAMIRVRNGVQSDDVVLGPLGYSDYARASFATFRRLARAGTLPERMRFQVSLPTPIASLVAFPVRERLVVEPAYEQAMLDEVRAICATVPHERLAVQWDTAVEFALLEGAMPSQFGAPDASFEPLVERLVRIGDAVPADVELGYHLCYGDAGHVHFVEPRDAALLIRVANAVSERLARPLTWLHFPVPRDRTDDGYYAPLAGLTLDEATEVYVGLVHHTGGAAATRVRIAAAQRHLARPFGIATECGMGRRDPATVPALLRQHATLAAPVI